MILTIILSKQKTPKKKLFMHHDYLTTYLKLIIEFANLASWLVHFLFVFKVSKTLFFKGELFQWFGNYNRPNWSIFCFLLNKYFPFSLGSGLVILAFFLPLSILSKWARCPINACTWFRKSEMRKNWEFFVEP